MTARCASRLAKVSWRCGRPSMLRRCCAQAHPGLTVELVPLLTQGDRIQDRSLAAIGGKGLVHQRTRGRYRGSARRYRRAFHERRAGGPSRRIDDRRGAEARRSRAMRWSPRRASRGWRFAARRRGRYLEPAPSSADLRAAPRSAHRSRCAAMWIRACANSTLGETWTPSCARLRRTDPPRVGVAHHGAPRSEHLSAGG